MVNTYTLFALDTLLGRTTSGSPDVTLQPLKC
jgi:hypothetical protein